MNLTLETRDLTLADVPGLEWAGGQTHLNAVAKEIGRTGDAEYVGVFLPSGRCVGKAGITYTEAPDAGVIWQVAVHPVLQSCGIGAHVMREAEKRISARGLAWAQLGVETSNPRARVLYERLGYQAIRTEDSAWDQEREDGTVFRYETVLTIMRKPLGERGIRAS